MRDTNTVTLIGRLTRDADIKTLRSGGEVATYSLANNYSRKAGESWTTDANFFDCEQFRGVEGVMPYLTKGKQVSVTGTLRQDRWIATDGTNRSKVKIIVLHLQLLGGAEQPSQFPHAASKNGSAVPEKHPPNPAVPAGAFDDDVPF